MLLFWFSLFLVHNSIAEVIQVELPPIIKEGTPGDLLLIDPVVPASDGSTLMNTGSGSIQNSLQNQLAVPISDSGRAGGLAQVRGLGPSAEDVDVQAFGLSLNPPQGGGFDLSAFPQFIWSGFRYQPGPSLNAFNPTASTGALTLVPWTASALSRPGSRGRLAEFYSSVGSNQVSVAGKVGENFAAVAGYSSINSSGPSAAVSTRWEREGYWGAFHLLATDVDAKAPGSTDFPSPQARMITTRMIPVFENDFRISDNVLKTSIFYDYNRIQYKNPEVPLFSLTDNQVHQWGFQSTYLTGSWKVGLSVRQIDFETDATFAPFKAPFQTIGNLQASREIQLGSFLIEPVFQGVWMTGLGVLPQGSLGARWELDPGRNAVYSRVLFSRRIPSLLDRYSVYQDFVGNPALQAEKDWTGIFGWENRSKISEFSLQGYAQLRENARVSTGQTVTNLGDAYILAITGKERVIVSSWMDFFESLTASQSKLIATGTEFPYVPQLLNNFGVSVHSAKGHEAWEWSTAFRSSSSQLFGPNEASELPGYGVLDTTVRVGIFKGVSVAGRVENLFKREYELVKGYPLGRIASVMLMGEL
jgi:hypothetical protein